MKPLILVTAVLFLSLVSLVNADQQYLVPSTSQQQVQPSSSSDSWAAFNDLTLTTLLEITEGLAELAGRNEAGTLAPTPADSTTDNTSVAAAASFGNLLDKMKQNLVEQQQDAIDQYTKEEALCTEKLKMLSARIKHVNDTLVSSNHEIAVKKARIAVLKPQIAKIVARLEPKAADLEVIVKTIEQGTRRRTAQLSSNFRKINETSEMIIMLDQVATQLAATLGATANNATNASSVTFKFREQMRQMSSRISDPALQSLLASAISLADTSGGGSNNNAALESLSKLQKLLVLLDKEMHDYLSELKQAEDSAKASWDKVLSTFAAERKLIQTEVERLLSDKKVATDEAKKLDMEIKHIEENIHDLPQKLDILTPQFASWRDQCRLKKQYFQVQSKERENQLSTIDAVNRVSSTLQGTALQQALDQVAQNVRASRVP